MSTREVTIDWNRVRSAFPITASVSYLNAAAAGPMARATMQAATGYYRQMTEDADQHWDEWLARREEVRKEIARFINAEPDEIGLTTNTSSGMNAIVDALEDRREVISCDLEFPVSTITWLHRDIPVQFVKPIDGVIHTDDLIRSMNDKSGVLSLSHVEYSNGYRFDLDEIGKAKRDHALVINASQSAGAFEIDVKASRIDALCATGHKWMLSGYGAGFVYISRELQARSRPRAIGWLSVEDPYAMINSEIHRRHDAAARVELGCPHFAGMFALGASVSSMMELDIRNIQARVLELNSYLTDQLSEGGWNVLSPLLEERFRSGETLVELKEPGKTVAGLAERGVLVTEKPQGMRVATHFFNNEADIDRLIKELPNAAR